ncbi:MAG: carboxymuconolactone decarboxylase family protein [Lentimicrobiaceae bacterium]|nr:carboxymuconolactone decarboxylase family protein [Lentimicrobiaceae bacterium]MCO5265711.1 carboxymuconolactone decarboxylase family protein [Lentimicrobium sp.]HPG34480.1 carboxymuconolactone decarboxylase family protein [Lentimicrobium sp.]
MKNNDSLPKNYEKNKASFPAYFDALEKLGETIRETSPLPDNTMCLINLAAAAAIQSEGAVHSHTRRALEAGVTPEEIRHTILLLTSTIGFPRTMAAMSWVNDLIPEKKIKKLKEEKIEEPSPEKSKKVKVKKEKKK